jgi:hypothetical protein
MATSLRWWSFNLKVQLRNADVHDLLVVNPVNVVPKKQQGKYRLTVNMRYVNARLEMEKFKFESLSMLLMWRCGETNLFHLISRMVIIIFLCTHLRSRSWGFEL